MFRFFKYIVLFILGYKLLKTLFADNQPSQGNTQPPQPQPNNHQYFNSTTSSTPQTSKYDDAELIDYEEVK